MSNALGIGVGERVTFAKTVSESDVYLFAGITGDFAANHVNEQFMRDAGFEGRIAHGALLIGYVSTCSTMMAQQAAAAGGSGVPLSLGFDRIRFLKPVYLGDTINISYAITEIDTERRRARAAVEITNQSGELVGIAEHILAWSPA